MVYGPGYGPVYPRSIDSKGPRTRRYTIRMIDEAAEEHLITVNARSPEVAIGRARIKCTSHRSRSV
jgi:hypothetical protein